MPKTSLLSTFFTIGTSGQTVDGREVSPEHINQMAETYDPAEYTAVINLEHFNFIFPGHSYGTVKAVRAVDGADNTRKLQAQIEPTADLIKMNAEKQKLFTSMEVNPDFKKSGKAYLVGLAVTDRPACTGLDALCFSAKNGGPGDARFKENMFTKNYETDSFTMDDAPETPENSDPTPKVSFAQKFAELFKPTQDGNEDKFSALENASLALAEKFTALESAFSDVKAQNKALQDKLDTQSETIQKLRTALESTPDATTVERPTVTGGPQHQTDC